MASSPSFDIDISLQLRRLLLSMELENFDKERSEPFGDELRRRRGDLALTLRASRWLSVGEYVSCYHFRQINYVLNPEPTCEGDEGCFASQRSRRSRVLSSVCSTCYRATRDVSSVRLMSDSENARRALTSAPSTKSSSNAKEKASVEKSLGSNQGRNSTLRKMTFPGSIKVVAASHG